MGRSASRPTPAASSARSASCPPGIRPRVGAGGRARLPIGRRPRRRRWRQPTQGGPVRCRRRAPAGPAMVGSLRSGNRPAPTWTGRRAPMPMPWPNRPRSRTGRRQPTPLRGRSRGNLRSGPTRPSRPRGRIRQIRCSARSRRMQPRGASRASPAHLLGHSGPPGYPASPAGRLRKRCRFAPEALGRGWAEAAVLCLLGLGPAGGRSGAGAVGGQA